MRRALTVVSIVFGVLVGAAVSARPAHAITYGWSWPSPTITVSDQTSGSWPVQQAVDDWNRGNLMHLAYTRDPCGGCITVVSVNYIPCDTCGTTSIIAGDTQCEVSGGIPSSCLVRLSELQPLRYRLLPVNHELGHTFGLAHAPPGVRSVMVFPWLNGSKITAPQAYDFRDLRALGYGRK